MARPTYLEAQKAATTPKVVHLTEDEYADARKFLESGHGFVISRPGEPNLVILPPGGVYEVKPVCSLCEGAGEVAKNFGLESMGTPEIVPCPQCFKN